ncbi:MAG TPA: xanthine dehydrogenase family protein molybdopterin-binding subunit [Candidatus Limnocylindrales bacterium]|nr:xanthine dehydrogenase family protein molybdopterin-binding subunit [Candidatus Limnocylindrales bacterium]
MDARPDARPSAIGRSMPRIDGRPKVTGQARFAADYPVRGMLHARPVLAMPTHARIERIDVAAALAVPGVVAVLTAADLPIATEGNDRVHEPLARTEILWAGQPVALVVAETSEAAADAALLVHVETTRLEPVVDLERAFAPGAARARLTRSIEETASGSVESQHAAVGGGTEEFTPDEPASDNVAARVGYRRGDVDAVLAASDVVVEGRFTTSWVHQGYLEPQVATAAVDEDGVLHVTSATQGTFHTRWELARLFGRPMAAVRVTGATLGGAFGGKYLIADPLAAAATLVVGRPVRVELTRNEDFRMSNPAPATLLDVRIGASRDGMLRGLQARLLCDAGAFAESSIEGIAAVLTIGPYRWDAHEVTGFGIETNRFGTGAYRAPGATQATFALEQLIDELALRVDIDPAELRRRNLVGADDEMADGTPWGSVGLADCLGRIADHPLYRGRESLPDGEGVGIAAGAWPGSRQAASAICRLEPDGRITVVTGVVDMSGTMTGFAAIAAEGLGLAAEDVSVVAADTASAPRSPFSGGSVVTYSMGRAVERATAVLREKILGYAALALEIDVRDLEIVDAMVRPRGTPERGISLADIGERMAGWSPNHEPLEGHAGSIPPGLAPLTVAHLVHVRVDGESGAVSVLDHVIAQDVGRAINPAIIEGQLHGGATQGLGWALSEAMLFDDSGQLLTGTFLDYALPTADASPRFETLLVEVPSTDGPYGARGIGEGPVCGAAAAVANAVHAATGVRYRSLPMTAPRIWRGMQEARRVDAADQTGLPVAPARPISLTGVRSSSRPRERP